MLKKAGIVVATAAAGLLAVSPLAFAGDKGDHGYEGHNGHHGESEQQVNNIEEDRERSSSGLINVDALNGDNDVNVCPNVQVDVLRILSNNALGVLGEAEAGNDQEATCVNNDSIEQDNDD